MHTRTLMSTEVDALRKETGDIRARRKARVKEETSHAAGEMSVEVTTPKQAHQSRLVQKAVAHSTPTADPPAKCNDASEWSRRTPAEGAGDASSLTGSAYQDQSRERRGRSKHSRKSTLPTPLATQDATPAVNLALKAFSSEFLTSDVTQKRITVCATRQEKGRTS